VPDDARHADPAAELAQRRWLFIRDLAGFSVKLLIEALRDLVLIPLALLAGAAGLVLGGSRPERFFQEVLEIGRRFDAWLNLFGEHDSERGSLDEHLRRLEAVVREQHARGGATAQAKRAIDRALDAVQGAVGGTRGPREPRG
jgi:hypothetical protein